MKRRFLLPDLILTHLEARLFVLPTEEPFVRIVQWNLLFFWVVLGLSAVREFMVRGGGTPVPFDPPTRLVTTGLYAYVSNPMQVSSVGAILTYAWIMHSWGIFGMGVMVVIYSVGVALPSETSDLSVRFGAASEVYSKRIKAFFPRWKPITQGEPSTIYFSRNCSTCSNLRTWLESQAPVSLIFEDAEDYPGPRMKRLTYVRFDRSFEGVDAFAVGLGHINLGWAIVACFIRLPGVRQLLQLIADAGMFGPTAEED